MCPPGGVGGWLSRSCSDACHTARNAFCTATGRFRPSAVCRMTVCRQPMITQEMLRPHSVDDLSQPEVQRQRVRLEYCRMCRGNMTHLDTRVADRVGSGAASEPVSEPPSSVAAASGDTGCALLGAPGCAAARRPAGACRAQSCEMEYMKLHYIEIQRTFICGAFTPSAATPSGEPGSAVPRPKICNQMRCLMMAVLCDVSAFPPQRPTASAAPRMGAWLLLHCAWWRLLHTVLQAGGNGSLL